MFFSNLAYAEEAGEAAGSFGLHTIAGNPMILIVLFFVILLVIKPTSIHMGQCLLSIINAVA